MNRLAEQCFGGIGSRKFKHDSQDTTYHIPPWNPQRKYNAYIDNGKLAVIWGTAWPVIQALVSESQWNAEQSNFWANPVLLDDEENIRDLEEDVVHFTRH